MVNYNIIISVNVVAINGISFCLCLFFLYVVRFFNVRLEVRPSLESLFRWRGPFLCSVVVVVVGTCIAGIVVTVPVVRFLNMCL